MFRNWSKVTLRTFSNSSSVMATARAGRPARPSSSMASSLDIDASAGAFSNTASNASSASLTWVDMPVDRMEWN